VTKAIPHVIVRLNGALQSKAPEQVSQGPCLVICLNGVIQNVVPLPHHDGVSQESDNFNGADSEDVELDSDAEDGDKHDSDGEEGELISHVDQFYKMDINEKYSEDGPDWMFPRIPNMFSVQLLIENKFSTCSQNTSVSTHSLQKRMENGQRNRFATMQSMRCTHSVAIVDFERCGHICGHAGTHRRCGSYGQGLHHPTFHSSEQQCVTTPLYFYFLTHSDDEHLPFTFVYFFQTNNAFTLFSLLIKQ